MAIVSSPIRSRSGARRGRRRWEHSAWFGKKNPRGTFPHPSGRKAHGRDALSARRGSWSEEPARAALDWPEPGWNRHSRDAGTSSIYQATTHGCIRLQRDPIADLYSRVMPGMRGPLIYEAILIAESGDGVYIEVHADVYRRLAASPYGIARALAGRLGLANQIDWSLADRGDRPASGSCARVSSDH